MNTITITWLGLFGLVVYFVLVDKNVAEYVNLIIEGSWIQLRKWYWMARLHPKNPITNLIMEYKMKKLAKELLQEFNQKQSEESND